MASAISLAGGMALGLASSLHCIGMCGGISVMLGYSGGCGSTKAAMGEQAMLHGGRIISYTALGAVAGGLGTAALGPISAATGHEMLRWAAALSLGWIGLATAGLAPVPAFSRTATAPLRRLTRPLMRGLSSMPPNARRMAGGLAWGLMPCGMVYGALLFALFAGTVSGGAGVMIGFGLGTLPALIAANMSFHRLQTVLRGQHAQRWMGGAMMLIAMLSLVDDPAKLGAYCMHLIS